MSRTIVVSNVFQHSDKLCDLAISTLNNRKPAALSSRKAVLDAIGDELRKRNYSPVVFDFEKPANRDITETVSILSHMARFVIADITEPKSIPQELGHI